MSFSQQNAWIRVKWICRATSLSSSSSAASRHRTTLSGSLRAAGGAGEHRGAAGPRRRPQNPPGSQGSRPDPLAPFGADGKQQEAALQGEGHPAWATSPGWGWKGVPRGTREGPHLHVEQLGRLVHPDRDGALTQSFTQHFLEGIPHLIHPTHRQEQRVASARVS